MPIAVRGLAPLLQVYDMPRALRFYRDVIGFEVISTSPRIDEDYFHWVLLRLDGAELMLNTAYEDNASRPDEEEHCRMAAGHGDACIYFGCPDVDGAYQHLLSKGLLLHPPKVARYGWKQLYLKDPDGFGLCFHWPAEEVA